MELANARMAEFDSRVVSAPRSLIYWFIKEPSSVTVRPRGTAQNFILYTK